MFMHRQIMQPPSDMQIDHIDHDCLNNQRANLRVCTQAQNNANRRKTRGSSQFKGVYWYASRNKWRANIRVDRQTKHLGYFDDEEDAARAYNEEALKQFREFALLNEV